MKKKLFFLLCICSVIFLVSCGNEKTQKADSTYQLYYLDEEGTGLASEEYTARASANDTVNLIDELIQALQTGGHDNLYKNPISSKLEVSDFQIKETQLSLYFSAAYNAKTGVQEILSRAAIVKTLCQVSGVEYIEFYVEDQPLMLSGTAVGLMNEESFVNELNESSTMQSKQVTLYFAGSDGQMLVEMPTDITYNAAEPLAQLLMEKLIAGPASIQDLTTSEVLQTIPANTNLNSVTIRDNICYVDLSKEFNELLVNVKSNVVIYSIVNTLCELPNVNKVQFTIEGEQQEKYGETTGFSTSYERNLDIVEGGTESQG